MGETAQIGFIQKKTFFCIEATAETSRKDFEDLLHYLNSGVVERFNCRWCQVFWKDNMEKKPKVEK